MYVKPRFGDQMIWFDAGHAGPFAQVEQAIKNQALLMDFAQRILNDPDT